MKNSILFLIIPTVLFSSCSKNEQSIDENQTDFDPSASFESQIMSIPNNSFTDVSLITDYSEVMKEVLSMAKKSDFRIYMYEESKRQSDAGDDYLVYLNDVSKSFISEGSKYSNSAKKLSSLTLKIKSYDSEIVPMIFFPKSETIEDNVKSSKGFSVAKSLKEPIAVLTGAYNDDYSIPGYKLDSQGDLVYDRMVTEDYAWNNDVYVIGAAENVQGYASPCNNMQKSADCYGGGGGSGSGSGGSSSSNVRTDGRSEHGGWIQVTSDLNEIESWWSGKLEFRMVIAGVQGSSGTVIRDIPFPKVKRKYFKNKKWYNYETFLFNWNLSNLGDYNIEKWIERDGGSSSEISMSIPGSAYKPATSTTPSQPAFPGTTVKVSSKKADDDLGISIVQFSDNLTQVYDLGKINFKRK